jgi:D-alanyl-D-alanine carboxypeptidase
MATALAVPVLFSVLVAGSATAATACPGDGYRASIQPVDAGTAAEMTGVSWHEGCPVAIADLRLLELTFWGFDGYRHRGELVVHEDVAASVVDAFHTLYTAHFPINKMRRVDYYGGSDDASMADDNTSAFNCRPKTGSTSGFSVHSYGKAIDINTVENPYVKGSTVLPAAGAAYLDRTDVRPGMIVHGDLVWSAFIAHGFQWGGDWTSLKDYQHFEFPI